MYGLSIAVDGLWFRVASREQGTGLRMLRGVCRDIPPFPNQLPVRKAASKPALPKRLETDMVVSIKKGKPIQTPRLSSQLWGP